jgi:hypothetical protein
MRGLRVLFAAIMSLSLAGLPVRAAATPAALGTVITAERARVGEASLAVGTTVYGGDVLSTDLQGSLQIRAGAARLLLSSSSSAMVNDDEGAPSAKLLSGTATFSTGNLHAFTLYAATAAIRPQTDAPTIGRVSYVNEKELVVQATRGGLTVTVDGETQVIPEGTAYRVLLDPPRDTASGPAGAGGGQGGGPLKAGRSRFLLVVVGLTTAAAVVAISEALESPARPR